MASALRVEEVAGRRGLKRFLAVPKRLYPPASPWVAPLDYERRRFFEPKHNAFLDRGRIRLFLAVDGAGRDVGRVAAIENPAFNEFQGSRYGFFGFFESPDDQEVARALLDTAAGCAVEAGHEWLHGPVSPSTNHECGLLVEGFDDPPTVQMPWNPPYCERLLHGAGFEGAQDLVAVRYDMTQGISQRLARSREVLERRHKVAIRPMELRRFDEELARFKLVYNEAWADNYGFVPLSDREIDLMAKELRPLIVPELCHIAEVDGEVAGASLSIPDFNQALKPLRGRLFPFGWLRLLVGMRRIDRMRGMVLGVRRSYRRMAIDHVLLHDGLKAALERGYRDIEVGWMLADNEDMMSALERSGARVSKRYRLYERPLG